MTRLLGVRLIHTTFGLVDSRKVIHIKAWHVATVTFSLLLTRLPESMFRAQFWADDGRLYSQALEMGPASIVDPYGGYLLVGQRGVIFVETLLPAYFAPLVGNLVALMVLAGVAAFAASRRMPWDRRTGMVIALGIVVMPAADPIIGTLSHVQWSVALWVALVALARQPVTRPGRWGESAVLAVAGLTGVGSMLFWPLFLRQPRRLAIIGFTAVVQLVLYLFIADRYTAEPVDWSLAPQAFIMRTLSTPLVGPITSGLTAVALGLIVLALAVRAAWHSPYRWWFGWVALVPAVGGIVASTPTTMMLDPRLAGRYFFLAGAVLVVLIVTRWPRTVALTGVLLAGVLLGWRVEAAPSTDWAARSRCIGGPNACTVPVEPDQPKWNVEYRP